MYEYRQFYSSLIVSTWIYLDTKELIVESVLPTAPIIINNIMLYFLHEKLK